MISAVALALALAVAQDVPAGIPLPSPDAPIYAYGLTPSMVPATDYAPAPTAPDQPIDVWFWQFQAVETDGFDATASRARVDCAARTFQFLGHAGFRDGQFVGVDLSPHEPATSEPGSTAAGLLTHICDPDPDREVRRYTNHRTARETFDAFFAER